MAWLVQLAQLVCSEQGFLQDGRVLWLGLPGQRNNKTKDMKKPFQADAIFRKCTCVFGHLTSSLFTDEPVGSSSAWIGPQS